MRSIRTRLLLGIGLVGLLAWGWFINYRTRNLVPGFDDILLLDEAPPIWQESGPELAFLRCGLAVASVKAQIDLDSSDLLQSASFGVFGERPRDEPLVGNLALRVSSNPDELELIDPKSKEIVQRISSEPRMSLGYGVLLRDRYWVAVDSLGFHVIDLLDERHLLQSSPLPNNVQLMSSEVNKIGQTDLAWIKVADQSRTLRKSVALVFSLDHQQIRVRGKVPIPDGNYRPCLVSFGGRIVSVSSDLEKLEYRSAVDLALTKSIPWPEGPTEDFSLLMTDLLYLPTLVVENSYQRVLRLRDLTPVEELAGFHPLWTSNSDRYVLFQSGASDGSERIVVWDAEEERIVFQQNLDEGYACLRDDAYYRISRDYGVTLDEVDLKEPERGVVRRKQPFAWVAWSWPLLVLSCVLWLVAWGRESVRAGTSIWLDAFVAVASAALLFRVGKSFEEGAEVWRTDSIEWMLPILMAVMYCTTWSLLFGREQFGRRVVVWCAAATCSLAYMRMMIRCFLIEGNADALSFELPPLLALVVCSLGIAVVVWLTGYRYRASGIDNRVGRFRFGIADGLGLVTCFAVFLYTSKSIGPDVLDSLLVHRSELIPGFALGVTLAITSCAALTRARWPLYCTGAIISALALSLLAEWIYEFACGWPRYHDYTWYIESSRSAVIATTCVFLFGWGLRLRGVCGGWKRAVQIA